MNVIRILRPDLTEEEFEKRLEKVKQAALELIIATEKAKILKKLSQEEDESSRN